MHAECACFMCDSGVVFESIVEGLSLIGVSGNRFGTVFTPKPTALLASRILVVWGVWRVSWWTQ